MLDAQMLADRYVAAWNEPDATRRLRSHRRAVGAGRPDPAEGPAGGADSARLAGLPLDRQRRTAFVFAPPRPPDEEAMS